MVIGTVLGLGKGGSATVLSSKIVAKVGGSPNLQTNIQQGFTRISSSFPTVGKLTAANLSIKTLNKTFNPTRKRRKR